MHIAKTQKSQGNKSLFEEEERERLIAVNLSEEEVDNLLKGGFSRDQIAYVAKEKEKGNIQCDIIGGIIEILTWLIPPLK